MRRSQVVLLALLALLAVFIGWLAFRTRQPPVLPADVDHAWVDADTCLACHGPEGGIPQSRDHPLGFDCLRCHGQP